jgi:hypothetical protein
MITIFNNLPLYNFRITEGFVVTDKDTIADIETADICASVVALRLEQPYRV